MCMHSDMIAECIIFLVCQSIGGYRAYAFDIGCKSVNHYVKLIDNRSTIMVHTRATVLVGLNKRNYTFASHGSQGGEGQQLTVIRLNVCVLGGGQFINTLCAINVWHHRLGSIEEDGLPLCTPRASLFLFFVFQIFAIPIKIRAT